MLIDKTLELCDSVNVAAAAGTAVVGSVLDFGANAAKRLGQLGSSRRMSLVITVETSFTSGGAATVQFRLGSDTATPNVAANAVLHVQSGILSMANLARGNRLILPLPEGLPNLLRYMQLQVVTAVATTTAGTINAFLTMDPEFALQHYPDNVSG